MLIMLILKNDVYRSSLLSGLPGLIHGYSTRALGDARIEENARRVVQLVAGAVRPMVRGEQIHGNDIAVVSGVTPQRISGVDGLVSKHTGVALEVHVADCVPVLLADTQAGVFAAVHAGWKGTRSHIVQHAVKRMKDEGAQPDRIYASIGPHIGGCCYTVTEERARMFLDEFTAQSPVAYLQDDGWHLDIGAANLSELTASGIPLDHIDAPVICTSCQVDTFYSFRKDTKETFGEIIGVIGKA